MGELLICHFIDIPVFLCYKKRPWLSWAKVLDTKKRFHFFIDCFLSGPELDHLNSHHNLFFK